MAVIEGKKISRYYTDVGQRITVLNEVDIAVNEGEMVAIVGASGSGKSTLLQLLGGLDLPNSGEILINGNSFARCSENKKCRLRNQHLGFIYQFHHLLPEFSALENVAMPLLLRGESVKRAHEKSKAMLEKVGLLPRLEHKIAELSGGERQRAAVARALVHQPQCVLADEPTGNLDPYNAATIFDLMLELQKSCGISFVIVTHDINFARKADHVFLLEEAKLLPYSS